MPQDPEHIFAYWELSQETLARCRESLGEAGSAVLVIYSAQGTEQREVDLVGGNYYLHVLPASEYRADLALRGSKGQLVTMTQAQSVKTPAAMPSDKLDSDWLVIDETFNELLLVSSEGDPAGGPSPSDRVINQHTCINKCGVKLTMICRAIRRAIAIQVKTWVSKPKRFQHVCAQVQSVHKLVN